MSHQSLWQTISRKDNIMRGVAEPLPLDIPKPKLFVNPWPQKLKKQIIGTFDRDLNKISGSTYMVRVVKRTYIYTCVGLISCQNCNIFRYARFPVIVCCKR